MVDLYFMHLPRSVFYNVLHALRACRGLAQRRESRRESRAGPSLLMQRLTKALGGDQERRGSVTAAAFSLGFQTLLSQVVFRNFR